MVQVARRRFVVSAGALLASSFARAQPVARRVRIGVLIDGKEGVNDAVWQVFRARLKELGYVEGKNIVTETRYSQGLRERLPALASELVALKPDVIVVGTTPATRAMMKATTTIPIVMTSVGDPVRTGLVASLARPGGNVTGQTSMAPEVGAKWIEILIEFAPAARTIAFLGQPNNSVHSVMYQSVHTAAKLRGMSAKFMKATTSDEVDRAFAAMVSGKFDGFVVPSSPVMLRHREKFAELALRHGLTAVYARQEYVAAGGLVSYGPDRNALFRGAADYLHFIVQGAKPADLPVQQPSRFELAVNAKTAKALGLSIPSSILLRASRVIE